MLTRNRKVCGPQACFSNKSALNYSEPLWGNLAIGRKALKQWHHKVEQSFKVYRTFVKQSSCKCLAQTACTNWRRASFTKARAPSHRLLRRPCIATANRRSVLLSYADRALHSFAVRTKPTAFANLQFAKAVGFVQATVCKGPDTKPSDL